ncbi:MAG: chromate resistance protein ChrB domain-containing protein [Pseudomonadota bacterium]|nr:chromate resistance protein ChrB domain-containing protein [Pseudomonadota bacterium]
MSDTIPSDPDCIEPTALAGLIGRSDCPVLFDVRTGEDVAADPRLVPTAVRIFHDSADLPAVAPGRPVVVICQRGLKLSHGFAARLRWAGTPARVLTGGHAAWVGAGLPLVASGWRDRRWVTRRDPRIDRIACPWLVRRFVDPAAEILYVPAGEVAAVADRFDAIAFDALGAGIDHRGSGCSFDSLLADLGLGSPALARLATIVRAADLGRTGDCAESAGLAFLSQGLRHRYADDAARAAAGLALYDMLYAACQCEEAAA